MAKKAEWKQRRQEELSKKLPWARKKIRDLGYDAEFLGDNAIVFRVNCKKVIFYPFTGGIQWEGETGIKERGMENLVKLIKEKENETERTF